MTSQPNVDLPSMAEYRRRDDSDEWRDDVVECVGTAGEMARNDAGAKNEERIVDEDDGARCIAETETEDDAEEVE